MSWFRRPIPASNATSSSLFDEQSFYPAFLRDIQGCRREVIIESPYITLERMSGYYRHSNRWLRGLSAPGNKRILRRSMTTLQRVSKNKSLLQSFRRYHKRYLSVGKKPNVAKLLPEVLFRTMRLEGEKITRKEAQALF